MRRWIVPVVLLTLAVAGCARQSGGDGAAPAGQPSSGRPVAVTITRTGGFAGVNQTIDITADGTWVYQDNRLNQKENGRLTPDQVAQLRQLVNDPAFVTELTKPTPTDLVCNDAFEYTVKVDDRSVSFSDCGDVRPVVAAAIAAVTAATPF
jgi:hypothetical protein